MTQEELAQLMYMQKGGLSKADTAGLFGANMKINPYMAGVGLVSTVPTFLQAIEQEKLLKDLQKEGIQDVTPLAFKKYQMGVNNQANNAKIAGYGTALGNIGRRQAAGLGNLYKGSINPSQVIRGALALNEQGIQAENQLDIQGARAQEARQGISNQAMLEGAKWEEKGRQEYNNAVSALRGAKAQNWNNFVQGLTGAALNSYVIGGPKAPASTKDQNFVNSGPAPTTFAGNQYYSNNKGPAYNPNTDPSLALTNPAYFTANASGGVSSRMVAPTFADAGPGASPIYQSSRNPSLDPRLKFPIGTNKKINYFNQYLKGRPFLPEVAFDNNNIPMVPSEGFTTYE